MDAGKVKVIADPSITDDQLWNFYQRNDICEVGFGKRVAVKPLGYPCVLVGAFYDEMLVGIARALFDGVSATIAEFCLECELQGTDLKYCNGSLIEKDSYGIGEKMGQLLMDRLRNMGNTFTSVYLVENCEEPFYSSLGLLENKGHKVYCKDERCYVSKVHTNGSTRSGD